MKAIKSSATYLLDQFKGETGAVLKATAIFVLSLVAHWGEERVKQVSVGYRSISHVVGGKS
jgi:hypothetical protein